MFRSIGRLLSTKLSQSRDMLQSAAEFQSRHLLQFSIVASFIAKSSHISDLSFNKKQKPHYLWRGGVFVLFYNCPTVKNLLPTL